mgnify:CR=1 FL=1
MHFEISRLGDSNLWHWQLVGDNGSVIAFGEDFATREQCMLVIDALRCVDVDTEVVETIRH